jgi:hypothetical protein
LLLTLSLTLPDILIFQPKKQINPPSQFNSSEKLMLLTNYQEKIMMDFSERIPNGPKMDLELLPLLTLSISEFLDTTCIIPKLTLIPLFWELLLFTILYLPLEEPLIVSKLKMTKTMTGLFVPSMELPLLIGSVPFLKSSDYLAPKKEKKKKLSKKLWLPNLY